MCFLVSDYNNKSLISKIKSQTEQYLSLASLTEIYKQVSSRNDKKNETCTLNNKFSPFFFVSFCINTSGNVKITIFNNNYYNYKGSSAAVIIIAS